MIIDTLAGDFTKEVAEMCAITVSPQQWQAVLDAHPSRIDARNGEPLKVRARLSADRKRGALNRLHRYDERVAPLAGTAHGVIQAVNYEHHETTVRGASRPERNVLRAVTGDFAKVDRNTFSTLSKVLS